jgi:hypothetical protein
VNIQEKSAKICTLNSPLNLIGTNPIKKTGIFGKKFIRASQSNPFGRISEMNNQSRPA